MPLLLSPPWINKYYIMDLAPGRSFAEYAVAQGHTVFAISYRNPDASMAGVALDDYLLRGPYDALDVIADITGADSVNVVGLCLGGTLTTMLLAHLAGGGRGAGHRSVGVRTATLLNTLVDFSEPGPMGQFLDKASVARLSEQMLERGYLEASEMSTMFDLLRPRDLIWNYVESGWLMGEPPPAFDILAWNADGTRMPADMHSFYLRCCYVENQLAKGEMTLAGTRLDLATVTADAYVLSAREDHIAPWQSAVRPRSGCSGARPGSCSRRRDTWPASSTRPTSGRRRYWTNRLSRAVGRRSRGVAGGSRGAPRLVVGGLGGMDRDPFRWPPPAAGHGERRPSPARTTRRARTCTRPRRSRSASVGPTRARWPGRGRRRRPRPRRSRPGSPRRRARAWWGRCRGGSGGSTRLVGRATATPRRYLSLRTM